MNRRLLSFPFILFLICGTIVPLLVIAFYGLTDRSGNFTLYNVLAIFSTEHFNALLLSLSLALMSTLICFLLAFPLGLILRNSRIGSKGFIIFVFVLPMWMNFLLRTMAWQMLLERGGFLSRFLVLLGFQPLEIMNTWIAVVLGMVYDYLPFMILPIYNSLVKIDERLIEAAYDLGANKLNVLIKIMLPLTVPGIVSGVTMVFVPSITTFAISNMLGGGKINLIGNIIEQEFTTGSNWNLGAGLSLVMMVFILISMIFIEKFDRNGEGALI